MLRGHRGRVRPIAALCCWRARAKPKTPWEMETNPICLGERGPRLAARCPDCYPPPRCLRAGRRGAAVICFPARFSISIPQQGEVIIPRRRETRAGTINQCLRVKQNKRINLQSGTVTRAVKSVLIIRRGGSKTRGEPKAGAPCVAAV